MTPSMEERLARCEERYSEIVKKLDRIQNTLEGNGRVGMSTRLDRLEVAAENAKWAKRASFGAVIAVLIRILYDVMISRSGG